MPQLDEVPTTNSVFIDDAKFGRDPLISKKRDQRTIQVSSSGMLAGSLTEFFSSVLLRSWLE